MNVNEPLPTLVDEIGYILDTMVYNPLRDTYEVPASDMANIEILYKQITGYAKSRAG